MRRVRRWLPYAAAILAAIVLYRFTRPVLFFIPADCVCTDWSDRIQGFSILNPLRNRAPERVADGFLSDMRDGKKSTRATTRLASQTKPHEHHLQWQLAFREDHGNEVDLYYRLDNSGAANHASEYTGEGMIDVERIDGAWKASRFDVVW